MKALPPILLGLVLLGSACQPAEPAPMTPSHREALADTIRALNQGMWDEMTPFTAESFDHLMSLWIGDPQNYYVGDPGVWVSNLNILSTPDDVAAAMEPVVGQRSNQQNTMVQDHVAVISRDAALHVYRATFAITDAEGETGEAAPWTLSLLWVRTPEGWRILHYHQSWEPAAPGADAG